MNPTIITLTARALLGRRRVLLLLPMPLIHVGLTVVGVNSGMPAAAWGPTVFGTMGLGVILPLTALIVGSSVLGLEVDDGTITHLLTKPLPRHEIVLSKLAVAWAVTTVTTAVPLVVAGLIAGNMPVLGAVLAAALGALAYTSLFVALSLLTKRPVAVGLVYIVLWENLLVGFVDGARVFSIREHATTLADTIGNTPLLESSLSLATALVISGLFVVIGTVGATRRLRSFSLTGEAN